jgi:hypothetical protein
MADIPEINAPVLESVSDAPERLQFHLKRDTARKPPPRPSKETADLEPEDEEPKRQLDVTA